jgi:predicted lipoprotein with Yx(FWY)xxD motif
MLLIIGLLCALCITACGGAAKADNLTPGSAVSTIAPSAQPTTNPIKVQVKDQNSPPQSNPQVKDQTPNGTNQPLAKSNTNTTSNNQKTQDTNPKHAQDTPKISSANTDSSSNMNNNNNTTNNNNNTTNTTTNGTSVTVVASTMLNVNGQMTNVLTTGNGLTLYTLSTDTSTNSTCTGACAQTWPPFMAQGNIVTGTPIQGSFTVQTTANGSQVEYNGHPLYTYSGDAIHQVNGQGINNVWYVVTPLAKAVHW